ncbi:hypothetical protein ACFX2H_045720 [Malus domestica]
MLQGIIFTCLICSSGRCGSFFESTAAVEGEYSRAVLGRQSGKGSKQSVLTWLKKIAPLRYLGSTLRQITRDFRKAEFAWDGCRRVWKSKMFLRFPSLPLRFFEWPLRIPSSPLRSLKSPSSADFYRGMEFVSKHT